MATEAKISAKGSVDGVPFSYEVSGDADFAHSQSFEMWQGKEYVHWLTDGSTYYVKANKSHGDLLGPTDHIDFLQALRKDRWLRAPESVEARMILVTDEIDDLLDVLNESLEYKQMKYQGVVDLDGKPAHRFSSPEWSLWLSATESPLPVRLETVAFEPYVPMATTYRDWNEEVFHDLPAEGDFATVSEVTTRTK